MSLSISGGSTETRDARRRPICALPKTESGAFSSSCSRPRPGGAFCYSRVPCSGGYVMRVPSTRANGVS